MPIKDTPPLKPEFDKSVEGARPKRRPPPYSLRLSSADREKLERDRGMMSLAAYIRWRLFDPDRPPPRHRGNAPVKDQHALSSLLAQLGQSRLSNNLNQLARAVNTGSLPVSPDVEADLRHAAGEILAMRVLLIEALGLKDEPK